MLWVIRQIATLSVRGASETTEEEGRHPTPWLTAIHAAIESGLPLWADDAGLWRLQEKKGVAAFGTDGLIVALQRVGG